MTDDTYFITGLRGGYKSNIIEVYNKRLERSKQCWLKEQQEKIMQDKEVIEILKEIKNDCYRYASGYGNKRVEALDIAIEIIENNNKLAEDLMYMIDKCV